MTFSPYISLYLQYTDIYGCKYNKKKWNRQALKRLFFSFLFFLINDVLLMLFLHKVPKNHSILWALNAHVMSSECSSVDPSMPISWSVCAHQTSTDKETYL